MVRPSFLLLTILLALTGCAPDAQLADDSAQVESDAAVFAAYATFDGNGDDMGGIFLDAVEKVRLGEAVRETLDKLDAMRRPVEPEPEPFPKPQPATVPDVPFRGGRWHWDGSAWQPVLDRPVPRPYVPYQPQSRGRWGR
jgi:hypothetical protein